MKKIIEVKNISKKIGKKEILKNISFDGYEGDIIGIVGNNGVGKTTLLKVLTGLYKPNTGEIIFDGINLNNNYEKAISKVGSLIETPDLYKHLTGRQNLDIFKRMFKGVDEETIKNIVSLIHIEDALGSKFKTYSLGMKERLGIAQTLINDPKIIILDEPTNGLDPRGIIELRNILENLKDKVVLISSHMLSEIEVLCNKVIILNNGRIVNIKEKNIKKKKIFFEVDDYSKAKLLLKDFELGEELTLYAEDETISNVNKILVNNNIKVYRIMESNSIENDFLQYTGEKDD